MIKQHIKDTEELQKQFNSVQELLSKKYTFLEEKLHEMQELYDTRPSRQEDLDQIKILREECQNKECQIKKAAEDMKFYKLELLNREQSYNKVFGAKPNIGIFNPIEGKDIQQPIAPGTKENIGTSHAKKRKALQ